MKRIATHRRYFGGLLLIWLSILSCTKSFESLNTHPYNPMEKDMTTAERLGNLFPVMLSTMHFAQENRNQHTEQMVAGQYGGYFTTTNSWQNTNFGTFNPALDWVEVPFRDIMVTFNSNYLSIKESTGAVGYIYAWANIIRVASMLRVVDTYGPIPYSKIGESNDDNIPFDDVQTVYHSMFDELTSSIATLENFVLASGGSTANPMAAYDVVYNGDFAKWIKFANSLKMRMAIRISAVDSEYARDRFAEGMTNHVISNEDNAFIPTQDNPYRKSAMDWKDLGINGVLVSYMNGFNDPRIAVYMTRNSLNNYQGVRTGLQNINKNIYGEPIYISKPNFTANTPLLVLNAAEVAFLKAEATLLGWIAGGDGQAKTFYEEGIRLSMSQHAATIGTYLNSNTTPTTYTDILSSRANIAVPRRITVRWDDSGTIENTKLEKIITQKWIANFPHGFESWSDQRRTGFPQFFPSVDNLSSSGFIGNVQNVFGRLVRRLPYPQSQYRNNAGNVEQAVSMLGADDVASTDLWWAKRN